MLIAALDFESTGLDVNKDSIIEVGAILYSTTRKHPMMTDGYFVDHEIDIPKKITEITGISRGMIDKFGLESAHALDRLQNILDMAEAIVGQNIVDFDMPLYRNWCLREKVEPIERLMIDTKTDLPGVEAKHLGYMAADAGFLNPFPHQAVSDCQTVLKLVGMHDIEKVVERAKSPRVYLQALVTFDTNYLAKERKYVWNGDRKVWYKVVKELDVANEAKECQFDVKRIEPIARN